MLRLALTIIVTSLAACSSETPPIASTPISPQLFRGTQSEVRLRCGSRALRARLRQGQIIAQLGSGEERVLAPVSDPRSSSGPAYSDGQLTLYKVRDGNAWALAQVDSATARCQPEAKPN
jgi:hypothetical protein